MKNIYLKLSLYGTKLISRTLICSLTTLALPSVNEAQDSVVLQKMELLEEAQLLSSGNADNELGQSISISGDTMAVVNYDYDDGGIYIFSKDGSGWNTTPQKIQTPNCYTVALEGDTLVVGDPDLATVYVYTRTAGNWTRQAELKAADGESSDQFGYAVAIDRKTIVVGAPLDDHEDSRTDAGSAYVFNFNGKDWEQDGDKLTSDSAYEGYGSSVAVQKNTLMIGAPTVYSGTSSGAVYVYKRPYDEWIELPRLTPTDGEIGDRFGSAIALNDDTVAIGAPQTADPGLANGDGAVYIYTLQATIWIQQAKLTASTIDAPNNFGAALSLSSNALLVGSADINADFLPAPGAAYVFGRDANKWIELATFTPQSTSALDWFGQSVALSGDSIVVRASLGDSVHVFSPSYENTTLVANYARSFLYRSSAVIERDLAAFRYLELLFKKEGDQLRSTSESLDTYYGPTEIERAEFVEAELKKGLALNPFDPLLGNVLLDIYYHRSIPKLMEAGSILAETEKIRYSPPSIPLGLVIEDEISTYAKALESYQSALDEFFSLFNNTLNTSHQPPLGYQLFNQLSQNRSLAPLYYMEEETLHSANGSTNNLFNGYKDLVLIYEGLRDYGRTAATHARLVATYDKKMAKGLITDAQQFLYLNTAIVRGIFPDLGMNDPLLQNSGLPEAAAAINACLLDLENLKHTLAGKSRQLGFEDDFLMLVQKFPGQSTDIFDSFDAYELRLNPTDLSSPLRYAIGLQDQAVSSFDDYRGFQDQLESQLSHISGATGDRLFQIVGAYPNSLKYEQPELNEGSEIWLQLKSIETSRLQIKRNSLEITNLGEEILIEETLSKNIQSSMVKYGNRQAKKTQEIGYVNSAQVFCNEIAAATSDFSIGTDLSINIGLIGHSINAFLQAGAEVGKGFMEGDKEQLAAAESAEIEGLQSSAKGKLLLLGLKTLSIDSQEAVALINQEFGRLSALLREKEDLERTLEESNANLAGRYFADPIHHLRYQHQTMLANLSFDEAQKWLYFMARALEYKWNTPFMNYFYLGRKWSTATLFKLRNAEELEQFYYAMTSFNSLVQLPSDDYFDWFSMKEDFLGYYEFDDSGTNQLYYTDPSDPDAPATLTATEAFRSYLQTKMDAIGNIKLAFSTRREIPGGTFYRGPRYDDDRNVLSAGLFLDKIKWMKISLPGSHSLGRSQLAGELSYGGTGFIRNFDVGTFHPERPDRLQNEETAYSTRYWYFHAPSAKWRFSESLKSPVTMQLAADPRVPPTVNEIDIFKERSVAASGWKLTVPTKDLGVPVLNIDELDDIELYFYHYAVSRQIPESSDSSMSIMTTENSTPAQERPFPYNLPHESNEE